MKEDSYLRKAFNEELANKESGWVTKMRQLLDSYSMSNLILDICKMSKCNCCIQNLVYTYKNENNIFLSQTKELFKKEIYLKLNNFNNINVLTKIRFASHNFVLNTTK